MARYDFGEWREQGELIYHGILYSHAAVKKSIILKSYSEQKDTHQWTKR